MAVYNIDNPIFHVGKSTNEFPSVNYRELKLPY